MHAVHASASFCNFSAYMNAIVLMCHRGKAPSLPLEPLPHLPIDKTNLKTLCLTPEKEQHRWGMRTSLVLPALATTMALGVIMLIASAMMQPELASLHCRACHSHDAVPVYTCQVHVQWCICYVPVHCLKAQTHLMGDLQGT